MGLVKPKKHKKNAIQDKWNALIGGDLKSKN